MNAKLAKKYRKVIGGITGVVKSYLVTKNGRQVIVDPNSNHGIYKRVKKARLTAKYLNKGVEETIGVLMQEQA